LLNFARPRRPGAEEGVIELTPFLTARVPGE
jgi:hypothetical protein